MNGKQAKRLRKRAREETIGLPALQYAQHSSVKHVKNQKGELKPVKVVTVTLDTCTRARYQELKRQYKKGLLHG